MKLTHASSYAIRAVAYMSKQKENPSTPSHKIAEAERISEKFLLKVLKPLVSAGILHSVKGPHGGYRLAKGATDISVLDIVEAVDGPIRGGVPFTEESGDPKFDKKLETICNQLAEETRSYLGKQKIGEMVGAKAGKK